MSADWPFDQPENAAAISLRRIFQEGAQILFVSHDEDDYGWQFLDGREATEQDACVVGMAEVVRHDPSVCEVADLPPGWIAVRQSVGGAWTRMPNAGE